MNKKMKNEFMLCQLPNRKFMNEKKTGFWTLIIDG